MVEPGQAFGSAASDGLVRETTSAGFSADVISASARQPVLVDFCSSASPASRELSAALEKAVAAAAGRVKLVRMNIDQHPQIAARLGVRGAPAVFAFQRGQPVDGFMGALPEAQIRGFIERLVGPIEDGTEDAVAEAEAALEAGDSATAAAIFSAIVEADPEHVPALTGLLRAFVAAGDLDGARAISAQVPASGDKDPGVLAARAALDLADQASGLGDVAELTRRLEADPSDHQARFDLALALNAGGQRGEAADALLAIMKSDRSWNDDGARKQLLQFFEAWSLMDPATLTARRKLSTLLFS